MREKFNTSKTYKVDHFTFGGLIYPSDFNTDYRGKDNTNGSPIANRIACDKKLDQQWRKLISNRKNMEERKCLEK